MADLGRREMLQECGLGQGQFLTGEKSQAVYTLLPHNCIPARQGDCAAEDYREAGWERQVREEFVWGIIFTRLQKKPRINRNKPLRQLLFYHRLSSYNFEITFMCL